VITAASSRNRKSRKNLRTPITTAATYMTYSSEWWDGGMVKEMSRRWNEPSAQREIAQSVGLVCLKEGLGNRRLHLSFRSFRMKFPGENGRIAAVGRRCILAVECMRAWGKFRWKKRR
jgi:hypothetical protein